MCPPTNATRRPPGLVSLSSWFWHVNAAMHGDMVSAVQAGEAKKHQNSADEEVTICLGAAQTKQPRSRTRRFSPDDDEDFATRWKYGIQVSIQLAMPQLLGASKLLSKESASSADKRGEEIWHLQVQISHNRTRARFLINKRDICHISNVGA